MWCFGYGRKCYDGDMNYLLAIASVYRDGVVPSGIQLSPIIRDALVSDRASMADDDVRLWIEPVGQLGESVMELSNGRRVYKYAGSFIYAFEKNGFFYPDPSSTPFPTKEDAVTDGEFQFLVDASQTVVGFYDDITGNTQGERIPTQGTSSLRVWLILIFLVVLVVFFAMQFIN